MIASGRLPNLSRWMENGVSAPLRSTRPPVTFPAWSSFLTGLEPGRHGLFDFTQKIPGQYRVRFVNAGDRAGESIFSRVSRAGGRVLVLGVPTTFPPEDVNGLLVPGFDAPVSTGSSAESASDPALYCEIEAAVGPWMRPALKEDGSATPERTLATLEERIALKTRFSLKALERLREDGEVDFMMVVFSESDTVGHHYWRDHDPASPRHDENASDQRRGAIQTVYERLDEACGELREAFGEDAICVVLSDHGMGGGGRHVVHLNRHLADHDLLVRTPRRRFAADALARQLRDLLLRILPSSLTQQLFRRARAAAARVESTARFGGFDWSRTLAFSEESNTQPGVWINLRGREAQGCVAPEDYEAVRDQVIEALLGWKLPHGGPIVAGAWRREEIYHGPFVERAPDVVVDLALDAGYGLSLVATPWREAEAGDPRAQSAIRELEPEEFGGGRGRGMNGTHRPCGIFIGPGAEFALDSDSLPRLVDMAPTLLNAMGIAWHDDDGESDGDALALQLRPYSGEEEAVVAERLRALGYLE